MGVTSPDPTQSVVAQHRAGGEVEAVADSDEGEAGFVEPHHVIDLGLCRALAAHDDTSTLEVLGNGGSADAELVSQVVDGGATDVASDEGVKLDEREELQLPRARLPRCRRTTSYVAPRTT
jgi:hypothetical protein